MLINFMLHGCILELTCLVFPCSWWGGRPLRAVLCSEYWECWAVGERRRRMEREERRWRPGDAAEVGRKERRRPSWGGEGWKEQLGSERGRWRDGEGWS